ncbi:sodium/hydrogen exchanger 9B2-like [Liolophura sinensis]|uniref:sodium/hydrogen exchanger 9B2-like n=1 Tax=Liolophura sinensis TaxID=3198878 RepID=UPI0031589329
MIVEKGENEVTDADRLSNGSCSEAMLPVSCHGNISELATGVSKDVTRNSVQETQEAQKSKNEASEIVEEEEEAVNPAGDSRSDVRCKSCKKSCHKCWKPVRTKYNPLPEKASKLERAKFAFLCPPHGKLGDFFAAVLTFLIFWAVLIAVTRDEAVPGGNIFALIMLFLCCVVCGHLVAIIRLPPLLGMLIAGCLLRNVPKVNIGKDIDNTWSTVLRSVALTVILLRAGLGLDPKALKKLSFVVIRLAFLPCLAECLTAAIASHLLLDFPWEWGFMLGFVLAAVSPAVVVPSLLSLQERGYGMDKGIPTLVIAAASVDDVLAITGFGVVLAIAFSTGDLVLTIFKGPLEALLGVVYGIVLGVIAWYIPHKEQKDFHLFRFIVLLLGGLLATFGSQIVDLPGAGPLGCLTLAFVAAYRWRQEDVSGGMAQVSDFMSLMWMLFQPLLFGLIGTEVDISTVQGSTIGLGVAVLTIGLFVRVIVSFLAVFKAGLTVREMLFIPLAWLPKATVQAAIGSLALDTARRERANDSHILHLGTQVLTIAVLVILITAPVGAALIALTGPRLLTRTPVSRNIHLSATCEQPELTATADTHKLEEEGQDQD